MPHAKRDTDMPVTQKKSTKPGAETRTGIEIATQDMPTPKRDAAQSRIRGIVAKMSPMRSRVTSFKRPCPTKTTETTRKKKSSSPLRHSLIKRRAGGPTSNTTSAPSPKVKRRKLSNAEEQRNEDGIVIRKPLWTHEGKNKLRMFLQHRKLPADTSRCPAVVPGNSREQGDSSSIKVIPAGFINDRNLVMHMLRREHEICIDQSEGDKDRSRMEEDFQRYILHEHDIEPNDANLSLYQNLSDFFSTDPQVLQLIVQARHKPSLESTLIAGHPWPDVSLRGLNGKVFSLSWIFEQCAAKTETKCLCIFVTSSHSPLFKISTQTEGLKKLVQDYGRRGCAHFLCVYVSETCTGSEEEFKERISGARLLISRSTLNLMTFSSAVRDHIRIPVVVDTMENSFSCAFGPGPERIYILQDQNIHFISASGGSLPHEVVEEQLKLLCNNQ